MPRPLSDVRPSGEVKRQITHLESVIQKLNERYVLLQKLYGKGNTLMPTQLLHACQEKKLIVKLKSVAVKEVWLLYEELAALTSSPALKPSFDIETAPPKTKRRVRSTHEKQEILRNILTLKQKAQENRLQEIEKEARALKEETTMWYAKWKGWSARMAANEEGTQLPEKIATAYRNIKRNDTRLAELKEETELIESKQPTRKPSFVIKKSPPKRVSASDRLEILRKIRLVKAQHQKHKGQEEEHGDSLIIIEKRLQVIEKEAGALKEETTMWYARWKNLNARMAANEEGTQLPQKIAMAYRNIKQNDATIEALKEESEGIKSKRRKNLKETEKIKENICQLFSEWKDLSNRLHGLKWRK